MCETRDSGRQTECEQTATCELRRPEGWNLEIAVLAEGQRRRVVVHAGLAKCHAHSAVSEP